MFRILLACTLTAAATFALTVNLTAHGGMTALAASLDEQRLQPSCPQPRYAANGNFAPLFCVIDNPLALRHFAAIARHTFALGPDASPPDVTQALIADYQHGGTEPTLCSIYQLAAWRNQWRFGISPVTEVASQLNFPANWCHDPTISGG